MKTRRHIQIIPTCLLSAMLCAILAPLAHGQAYTNVVFTESSPTLLTETLAGSPVGDWTPVPGQDMFVNTDPQNLGSLVPHHTDYDFTDPMNPGDFDVFTADDFYFDLTASETSSLFGGSLYQDNLSLVSDYIPGDPNGYPEVYAPSPNTLDSVNITVQGSSAADGCPTACLLCMAGVALAVMRHGSTTARRCPTMS